MLIDYILKVNLIFMALVFDRIKSTPGEVLLLLTALVTLVYSLNFMFFSVCYTTAGEDCFTLLNNGAPIGIQHTVLAHQSSHSTAS